jgi:branched-chain amino acid transport system substrate-binding protein
VVVAAVGEWTGPDERALRAGIELAAAEVNRAGGVGGRTLRVDFHDDGNDVEKAARVAAALVADARVVAVIGHTRSDPTLVAMKVYDGTLPVVTARFVSPDVAGLSRWVFQMVPTDSAYAAAAVRFAAERGWKRSAVIFNNTARGRATAEHFQRLFPGEVLSLDPATFPVPPPGDMKVFVELHRRQAPDLVYAPVGEPAEYIREAQLQGLRATVIGWDVWASQSHDPSLPGAFFHVVPFDLAADGAETRRFVEAYREAGGGAPSPFAALGYDAVRMLAEVGGRAGVGRRELRDGIAALTAAAPYRGAIGPVSFSADGTVAGPEPVIVPLRAAAPAAPAAGGGR